MPENPLISVVLLCHNQEKFVAEAVDGVLAQTYSPLEIVVIDDASTDATAEIIDATLAGRRNGSDVTFVRHPKNVGANVSSRIGLDMTKGRLILISAGDDIMLPEMIAEMAKVWIADGPCAADARRRGLAQVLSQRRVHRRARRPGPRRGQATRWGWHTDPTDRRGFQPGFVARRRNSSSSTRARTSLRAISTI